MNIPGQIQYVFLLGQRDEPQLTNVPQDSISRTVLRVVGSLPQTMSHFIYGVEFYEQLKSRNLQLGYNVTFIYSDATDREMRFVFQTVPGSLRQLKDEPVVLINCTDDVACINKYVDLFSPYFNERSLWVDLDMPKIFNADKIKCAVARTEDEIYSWLMAYAVRYFKPDESRAPFSVPMVYHEVEDMGYCFTPTWVNTYTINTIMGNWAWSDRLSLDDQKERKRQCSQDAFADENKNATGRQDLLCRQIRNMRMIEDTVLRNARKGKEWSGFSDQIYSPLVITLPYTSREMGLPENKGMSVEELQKVKKANRILSAEYSLNYVAWNDFRGFSPEEIFASARIQQEIVTKRMNFLDFVGMLHCSFKLSPYMRLPILGKNISGDLSKVGLNSLNSLKNAYHKKGSVRKVMEQVGRLLATKSMAPEFQKLLREIPSQIVAITDLPVEWTLIDGIPLCFTHDVCRLPETAPASILAQFVEAKNLQYIIPTDILHKTLVVFGNEESAFEQSRVPVVDLQKELGFKIRKCLTKTEFFDAIGEEKPELLIVDSHGGVDTKTHQSYLVIGNDIVTGEDVVKSRICPRLVFLSACNTFTTYNTVSTIANAFFEVGAMAVTVSYMPIFIVPATVLYIRLLRNLGEASQKNIHHNWLAFISHLMRTSFIMSPLEVVKSGAIIPTVMNNMAELNIQSMYFSQRRAVYEQLHDRELTKEIGVDYRTLLPHYLMYSTLGRADLIRFSGAVCASD